MSDKQHIVLCDLTHTGQKIMNESMPYGIACLATYLEEKKRLPYTVHLCKFPEEVYETISAVKPVIVGFANYYWNNHLGLRFAQAIKNNFPSLPIVFGGPNFPKAPTEQDEYLRRNYVIDYYIEGEGEEALCALVTNLERVNYEKEPFLALRSPNVRAVHNGVFYSFDYAPRIDDLDTVPSPYLTGKLDRYFEKGLLPLLETTRGCPFACTYCTQGDDYSNKVMKRRNHDSVRAEIAYIAQRSTRNKQVQIADSNFGMFKEDLETSRLLNESYEKTGYPNYVTMSAGKNNKEGVLEMAEILKGKLVLASSVQSLSPEVLDNVKRKNISLDQLLGMAQYAQKIKANSFSEVILGLPGDTYQRHIDSLRGTIDAGFNYIIPYTLLMFDGTELSTREQIERYGLIIRHRVVPRSFGFYCYGTEKFSSAEIEDVSVGGAGMSLDAYVECRLVNLTVSLFYNDRLFEEIQIILKAHNISIFDWLEKIHKSRDCYPAKVKKIYDEFHEATVSELWDDREKLRAYVEDPKILQKYIDGELGVNLLYNSRSAALIGCSDELNFIAFEQLHNIMRERRPNDYTAMKPYYDEVCSYSLARKPSLRDMESSAELSCSFDIHKELFTLQPSPSDLARPRDTRYRFWHDDDQKSQWRDQVEIFGATDVGMARALVRLNISGLLKKVDVIDA